MPEKGEKRSVESYDLQYGGMKKYTGAYFFLVEYTEKGKRVRTLETMPLYLKGQLNSREKIEQYCESNLGYEQPKVKLVRIKMYSLIKIDGFYLYLTGRTGNQLLVSNAVQLLLEKESYEYVGKIVKAYERYQKDEDFEKDENISMEKNLNLYKELKEKHLNQIYNRRPNPVGMKLESGEEKFVNLSIKKQIYVLKQILQLSQRGNQGADLTDIGESKKTGVSLVSKEVTKKQEFKLINKSVTGLYENEIDLLTV